MWSDRPDPLGHKMEDMEDRMQAEGYSRRIQLKGTAEGYIRRVCPKGRVKMEVASEQRPDGGHVTLTNR